MCSDLHLTAHSLNRYLLSSHHALGPLRGLGIQQQAGPATVLPPWLLTFSRGDIGTERFIQEPAIFVTGKPVVGK